MRLQNLINNIDGLFGLRVMYSVESILDKDKEETLLMAQPHSKHEHPLSKEIENLRLGGPIFDDLLDKEEFLDTLWNDILNMWDNEPPLALALSLLNNQYISKELTNYILEHLSSSSDINLLEIICTVPYDHVLFDTARQILQNNNEASLDQESGE